VKPRQPDHSQKFAGWSSQGANSDRPRWVLEDEIDLQFFSSTNQITGEEIFSSAEVYVHSSLIIVGRSQSAVRVKLSPLTNCASPKPVVTAERSSR
jgi:hypothetical protein